MNHGQIPVTGTSDSHKRPSRLTTVALVLALAGVILLGYAVMLIELWWKIDEATTTAQPAAYRPADKGSQKTR
jgi:hypothetical protein